MKKPLQQAAGFITVRRSLSGFQFLILQASNHFSWSPPKGYIDVGEDKLTCASREFCEETGTPITHPNCQIIPGKEYIISYKAWGGDKEVTWFVVMVKGDIPITLTQEHRDYRWATLQEFKNLQPGFTNLHRIMEEIQTEIPKWIDL